MSDKEIGQHLGIHYGVVNKHIGEAMRRLGVNSRKAARRKMGYFTPGLPNPIPAVDLQKPDDEVAAPGDDKPATRYRPPPTGFIPTVAIIGQFALIGGLVILFVIVVFGIKSLK